MNALVVSGASLFAVAVITFNSVAPVRVRSYNVTLTFEKLLKTVSITEFCMFSVGRKKQI